MAAIEKNYIGFGVSALTGKPHEIRHLPKDITWEKGIYQLEFGDKVIGGVDGVDNLPNQQLANRTEWLFAYLNYIDWKIDDGKKKNLMASIGEIQQIIQGIYIPTGSDGEGESNGVATAAEVAAIINGTYTSTPDDGIENYLIGEIPTAAEIQAIINGSYIHIDSGTDETKPIKPKLPSDNPDDEPIDEPVVDDFGELATADDIDAIMNMYNWDD